MFFLLVDSTGRKLVTRGCFRVPFTTFCKSIWNMYDKNHLFKQQIYSERCMLIISLRKRGFVVSLAQN